jgi:hypothetical protein
MNQIVNVNLFRSLYTTINNDIIIGLKINRFINSRDDPINAR